MADIRSIEEARRNRRLPPGGDGGQDGGMPPDDLRERVTRIEAGVDSLVKSVDKLGTGIGELTKQVGSLAERVALVEGQLKHVPTLWTVLVGQVAAAIAVAGIIIVAFTFGVTVATPKPTPATPGPARMYFDPADGRYKGITPPDEKPADPSVNVPTMPKPRDG